MRDICVFCGSNLGSNGNYTNLAKSLGKVLTDNEIDLIYGGANVGLMRIVAETVLKGKGKVTGVITHFLAKKHLTLPNLTKLIQVETMQERKTQMAELADAFIIMPGGMGTMEEMFEVLTAAQLGFHKKPVGILNIDGFYDNLLALLDHMVKEKFILPQHRTLIIDSEDPEELLIKMKNYEAPNPGKWIEKIISEN
jgi:uncharacterized protein (TIGR00730 family)